MEPKLCYKLLLGGWSYNCQIIESMTPFIKVAFHKELRSQKSLHLHNMKDFILKVPLRLLAICG